MLVATQLVEFLAVDDFTPLPKLDNLVGLLSEPSLEIGCLVVSDLDLIGRHVHALLLSEWQGKIVSIACDVDDNALFLVLDCQAILEVILNCRIDARILGKMEAK